MKLQLKNGKRLSQSGRLIHLSLHTSLSAKGYEEGENQRLKAFQWNGTDAPVDLCEDVTSPVEFHQGNSLSHRKIHFARLSLHKSISAEEVAWSMQIFCSSTQPRLQGPNSGFSRNVSQLKDRIPVRSQIQKREMRMGALWLTFMFSLLI